MPSKPAELIPFNIPEVALEQQEFTKLTQTDARTYSEILRCNIEQLVDLFREVKLESVMEMLELCSHKCNNDPSSLDVNCFTIINPIDLRHAGYPPDICQSARGSINLINDVAVSNLATISRFVPTHGKRPDETFNREHGPDLKKLLKLNLDSAIKAVSEHPQLQNSLKRSASANSCVPQAYSQLSKSHGQGAAGQQK